MKRSKSQQPAPPTPAEQRYAAAVKQLYAVFWSYRANPAKWCPCCIDGEERRALETVPLRELTADQIGPFAGHALLTCGGIDDFKHYLPRIFELLPLDLGAVPSDPTFLLDQMSKVARWREFPAPEVAAIDDWLSASLELVLNREPVKSSRRVPEAGEWFEILCHARRSMSPWTAMWDAHLGVRIPRMNLARYILEGYSEATQGLSAIQLGGLDDLNSPIMQWLISEPHAGLLDAAALTATDPQEAALYEQAASKIHRNARHFDPA